MRIKHLPEEDTSTTNVSNHLIRWLSLNLLAVAVLVWSLLVLVSYYRQIGGLVRGYEWETLYLYIGPSSQLFAGMLILLAVSLGVTFVVRPTLDRCTHSGHAALYDLACFALVVLAYFGLTFASAQSTIDPALPFLRAAIRNHVLGVGGALLLLSAATALGISISHALGWRYENWRERIPFAASLGIGTFANLGLVLALCGLFRPDVLQGIVALVLLATLGVVAVQYRRRGPHLPAPRLPRGSARIWSACSGLALLCAGVAALAPESQYDAVWYHLAYPRRYLEAGYLVDVVSDFVSLYPMTVELWFGYGLALGGSTAAVLLHYACLPLVAILTYDMARRLAPGASPWLAVALLVTVPTAVWSASTANSDLAMMLFVTLSFYALLRYVTSTRRQWLVLGALNLGFALATKHLALFALVLFCPGLLLALLRRKVGWRASLVMVLAFGLISLLLVLPWYLRSYLATGNPIFQTMYGIFGGPAERWNVQLDMGLGRFLAHFGRFRTIGNTLTLPWHMTIHSAAYGGTLGPLFLILLPLLALRRPRRALPWLVGFVVLWILLWASPLASFELRHLMPITPMLAVLGASGFGRMTALASIVANRGATTLLNGSLAVLMVLNLPPFTFLHEADRVEWDGWLTSVLHTVPLGVVIGGEPADAYLTRQIRSYAVWQFAEANLPPDAHILTWSGGDEFYTHLERTWVNSAPAYATAWALAGKEQQALEGLRELGITHLIVDKRHPDARGPWESYALTSLAARTAWYEELYADRWYVLYRVQWEKLDTRS